MEKTEEIKLELLRYIKRNAITLNSVCIPDYQSKSFTSDEIRSCLDFLADNKLITRYLMQSRYADITPEGKRYLKELEDEKGGWLGKTLKFLIVSILVPFLGVIISNLIKNGYFDNLIQLFKGGK